MRVLPLAAMGDFLLDTRFELVNDVFCIWFVSFSSVNPSSQKEISMSKGRKNASRGADGGALSSSPGSAVRRPMVRKTVIERLVLKADSMFSLGTEVAKLLQDRSAPDEIVHIAREFVPILEKYRERFFALRDSGWVPAEKAPKKDFQAGDRVSVLKAYLPRYDFIAGLAEGTTKLVAERFVSRGKSEKFADVVVKDADTGVVYGLIPKSHLAGF